MLPLLAAVALFALWAQRDAGYFITTWGPGGLFLLGLLAVTGLALGICPGGLPIAVRVAAALLAAFTAWSFVSVLWADDRGEAWVGADRTLVYLLVFLLFAGWRQRGAGAALVVGAWTLAIIGLAVVALLTATVGDRPLAAYFLDRLADPAGYPNAAAATWLMALWPAVALAGRPEVPWWLRGPLAGGAVVLVDTALLSQSRGALLSVPIVLAVFLGLGPGRVRTFAVLLPVAGAAAVTVPAILRALSTLADNRQAAADALAGVGSAVIAAALGVAVLVGAVAAVEQLRPPSPAVARAVHRGVAGVGVALVGAVAVFVGVTVGNPLDRVDDAWASFRGGYAERPPTSSRLTSGLGSNRYDFYRVSLDLVRERPLSGVGSENFAQDYLARRRSPETTRHPHSVELRALSQTGLVGAALLLGALAAAMVAALGAIRRAPPLAGVVAGASATVFAYWAVHGSVDWFWELPGLGAPAFAMLGLACALAPPRPGGEEPGAGEGAAAAVDPSPRRGRLPARAAAALAVLLAALAAAALALPWIAERDVLAAAGSWGAAPVAAFERLDRASRLNALSDRPWLVAGAIALRLRDLPRAERAYGRALERNPRNGYAQLELGMIAAARGDRVRAERLLAAAAAGDPSDRLTRSVLSDVRAGRAVDITRVNRALLRDAQRFSR